MRKKIVIWCIIHATKIVDAMTKNGEYFDRVDADYVRGRITVLNEAIHNNRIKEIFKM